MPFVWDIILRYSFTGRRSGFTRLVARASMVGMVLGVASLITVMSVMNGFANELNSRILSLVAHATVTQPRGQLEDWQTLAESIKAQGPVRGVAPYIEDTVLMNAWGRQRGVRVTGIEVNAQQTVSRLAERVTRGNIEALEQERFSVALGGALARMLGVSVGDEVRVTLPTLSVTPMGIYPRSKTLRVVAEFEVGSDLDATQAYVALNTARRLFARSGVDGVQLRFDNPNDVETKLPTIREALPQTLLFTDWRSTQGSLFTAVKMEKITVAILLMAVVAVAAFNIVSTLTMSVTEKATDIAVLRVMGLSSNAVMLLFMGHGLVLGGVGIILGASAGIALAANISELAAWVESVTGQHLFDPQVYYIGRLPSELQLPDVAVTIGAAMLLSLIATVYPAWRASRIQPIEALNHV